MNVRRCPRTLVVSAALLLGAALVLTLFHSTPIAASQAGLSPTPVTSSRYCTSSAPAEDCPDSPDSLNVSGDGVGGPVPESPASASGPEPAAISDYRYSSRPIPKTVLAEQLSVPDSPGSATGPEGVLVPGATYNASLRVIGSALRPRASTVEWAPGAGGGCVYASAGNPAVVFNTSVSLPQGATVKYLRIYVNDTDADSNSVAWFTVYDLYGDIVSEWGVASSGSAGKTYWTTSEFTHTVDYGAYAYAVNWRPYVLGSGTQLCGIRVYYQTPPGPVYLPLLLKSSP